MSDNPDTNNSDRDTIVIQFPPPMSFTPAQMFSGSPYFHEGNCGGYFCRNGCWKYFCVNCGRGTNRLYAKKCLCEQEV